MKRSTVSKLVGLLFVSPWIAGFLIFSLYPLFETVRYAFSEVRFPPGGVMLDPVGFNNFVTVLFRDPAFLREVPQFLKDMFFLVPMVIVFSVILAMFLNTKIKMRRVYRAIFFLPVIIISGPVLSKLEAMRATELRGVSELITVQFIAQSIPPVLGAPLLYIFENIVMFFWFSGVQILFLISGLQKVDTTIYEASRVDGASKWQQFWKITIPTIKPFIFLNTIYTIVDISLSPLNPLRDVIHSALFAVNDATTKGFGYGAAASWCYFGMILIVVIIAYLLLGISEDQKDSMKIKRDLKRDENRRKRILRDQKRANKKYKISNA